VKPFSLSLARGLAAFGIAATALAGPVAADPPVTLCTPDGGVCVAADVTPCTESAGCARVAADARACTSEVCAAGSTRACRPRDCTAVATTICARTAGTCTNIALGGIEKPAGGTITINQALNGPATMTLTGVYDPVAGFFACTLTDSATVEVRCVANTSSYDWYCAGWIVSATANTWTGQAGATASCLGPSSQSLQTGLAMFGSPQQAHAYGLAWFADTIVCEAWGYSSGPHPLGDYTVTCNEPGANAPGSGH
jgi:hypothetical protein